MSHIRLPHVTMVLYVILSASEKKLKDCEKKSFNMLKYLKSFKTPKSYFYHNCSLRWLALCSQ